MDKLSQEGISIKIIFPDRTVEHQEHDAIIKELKMAKTVAIRVNNELMDLASVKTLPDDSTVYAVMFESVEGKQIFRHSTSHIMAHAVKLLFPEAKLAIGPATDDGFYYDIDMARPLVPEDLIAIEKKMSALIKDNKFFGRRDMGKAEAIELFTSLGETYKVELMREIADETVSVYDEGDFIDMCRGPHIPSTGYVAAFKLLSIAGAYWRGNEKNKMLQRIYGTSFNTKDDLKKYLEFLEEVKKRDHRKIGKDLDLFSINEDIGPGLILWHPNGATIRMTIEDYWKDEHIKSGYKLLYTPHVARLHLWQKSGHTDFYTENMFAPMEVEGAPYEIKPMNCPFHIAIYKHGLKSYRDLPVRYAELGTVYRYERSGVLHGLLRVRGFTQDDAHIFAREDQIEAEIMKVLDFTIQVLQTFGFTDYNVYLSTRPEKSVGTDEHWSIATQALEGALKSKGLKYEIDPGEGVFYGPKIDIKVKDSLGRAWQCSTIQVDFNLPERFDVTYRGQDGKEHRPIMVHRALMGSLERFFGVLLEHYAGALPLWLSPVQVCVLTIAERHAEHARALVGELVAQGVRAEVRDDNEKIGYKIREATIGKVPYLVIIGDAEIESVRYPLRNRAGEQSGPFGKDELIALFKGEIQSRR